MPTLTEPRYEGEFIGELALSPGYHIDEITVLADQNLVAGTVVGKITASGKFVAFDNAGTDDGRRTAAGIIVPACNATGADKKSRALLRGPAVVNKNDLTWAAGIDAAEQAAALATLLTLGIKAV